jgi:hypothetical protein
MGRSNGFVFSMGAPIKWEPACEVILGGYSAQASNDKFTVPEGTLPAHGVAEMPSSHATQLRMEL